LGGAWFETYKDQYSFIDDTKTAIRQILIDFFIINGTFASTVGYKFEPFNKLLFGGF